MNSISLSLRGVSLALLMLAAVAHADRQADATRIGPHFAGLGRLGRDLVRRPSGEEVADIAYLNGLIRPASR